jgi:hypothetical protein
MRELEAREREIALRQAELVGRTLDRLRELKMLSAENDVAWSLTVAEIGSGQSMLSLRPAVRAKAWVTPTDIAAELGITAHAVGRAITRLGLRVEQPGLVESYTTVAPGESRTVLCWRYAPEIAEQIKAECRRQMGAAR